jgi:adenylate kinase
LSCNCGSYTHYSYIDSIGKTTTAERASKLIDLKYINVGEFVKKHDCYESRDENFDTLILDEDKLIDELEPLVGNGGYIVDFHSCEIFPERWFDLVLVLRSDTAVLYDRLTERGYNDLKRSENIECEIMQVVLEAARESYEDDIVHELQSNTEEDLDSNVQRIVQWYEAWKRNNP